MCIVICSKCKEPVVIKSNYDYTICSNCGEVIYHINKINLDDEKNMKIAFDSIEDSLRKNKLS